MKSSAAAGFRFERVRHFRLEMSPANLPGVFASGYLTDFDGGRNQTRLAVFPLAHACFCTLVGISNQNISETKYIVCGHLGSCFHRCSKQYVLHRTTQKEKSRLSRTSSERFAGWSPIWRNEQRRTEKTTVTRLVGRSVSRSVGLARLADRALNH